jgi:hypothetical protein
MGSNQRSKDAKPAAGARSDLHGQYRAIGIQSVAAALRYRGDQKNDAYAPRESHAAFNGEDDLAA